jgi:4-hydroxy-tetrahydrodipicolinate reductase
MVRVLLYGLGPIGAIVARQLAMRDGFRLVGAVDIDPAKVGLDVGELAGLKRRLRIRVDPDGRRAILASRPDVVALCTSSSVKAVLPQVELVLRGVRGRPEPRS